MDAAREEPLPFNPAAEGLRCKLWVRVVTPAGSFYHVYWRRAAAALALAMVCGWMMVAAGAWLFLRYQREWTGVSYIDIALYPARQREFRAALAEHYRAMGRVHLQEKNYSSSYRYFMSALRHEPENLGARKQAAINLVRYGMVPRALSVLADGLKYNPDMEYLKLLFDWIHEARQDEKVLSLVASYLPATPDTNLEHRYVALQAAMAHAERGRYDQVEKIISDWGLGDALEGHILLARCDWDRGFRDRAVVRLEGQIARFAHRDELYLQLIRFYRDLGRTEEARRYALLRQFNDPHGPGPRLDLAHGYRVTRDQAAEAREIDAYFREFGSDLRSLQLMADYAVGCFNGPLLERVATVAHASGFADTEFDLARVQLALAEHRFDAALEFSDPARRANVDSTAQEPTLIEGLRIVAMFAKSEHATAGGQLNGFLATAGLRNAEGRVIAAQLNAIGMLGEARKVLERVCRFDPTDQDAITELVRLDAVMGNRDGLVSFVPKLLGMIRPKIAVLEEALLALDETKDARLMAQVRAALASLRGSHAQQNLS